MVATVSPLAHWSMVVLLGLLCASLCALTRRRPGPWYLLSAAGLAVVLFGALNAPSWWGRRRHHLTGGRPLTRRAVSPSSSAPGPGAADV